MSPTKRVVLQHGAETQYEHNVRPVARRAPKTAFKIAWDSGALFQKSATTVTKLGGTLSATASSSAAKPTVTAANVRSQVEAGLGSSKSVGAQATYAGNRTDTTSVISSTMRGAFVVEHEPISSKATSVVATGAKKRPAPKLKGKTLPSTPSKVATVAPAEASEVRRTTNSKVLDDTIGIYRSSDVQGDELSILADQNFSDVNVSDEESTSDDISMSDDASTSDDASDFDESSDEDWPEKAPPAKKSKVDSAYAIQVERRLTNVETMQRYFDVAIEQLQRQHAQTMKQMLKIVSAQTLHAIAVTAAVPGQHPQAAKRQQQAAAGQSRRSRMTCFCCNHTGHGYYSCPQATQADIERIKNEQVTEANRRKAFAKVTQTQA